MPKEDLVRVCEGRCEEFWPIQEDAEVRQCSMRIKESSGCPRISGKC